MCFSAFLLLVSLLALACFSPLVAQPRKDACNTDAVFEQVNTQLAAHQYDLAARSLDGIRSCPALSDMETFQLGWLYGRARHFDVALKVFDRVPESVPDRPTHDFAIALVSLNWATIAVLPTCLLRSIRPGWLIRNR
jgi:hypothetical protein